MKYNIIKYGNPLLRKETIEISKDYPNLREIIKNMYETLKDTTGVGLAAPQIGLSIKLFIVSNPPYYQTFINTEIIELLGDDVLQYEGCLSIPNIREEVKRKSAIHIQYYDQNFNFKDEIIDGFNARIIQHELDHINGKLFIDYLSPLRKRLIKNKLILISKMK